MLYREEKSLRRVAVVAKFLDDNKPKTSREFTLFQTLSILFNFNSFVECWQNFLRLNPKVPYLSLENEKKENFCVVFTYFINQAHEISFAS